MNGLYDELVAFIKDNANIKSIQTPSIAANLSSIFFTSGVQPITEANNITAYPVSSFIADKL